MSYIFLQLQSGFYGLAMPRSARARRLWALLYARMRIATASFFCFSLIVGVLYIFEFHAVLSMGEEIIRNQQEIKDVENELNMNEAVYSRAYSGALAQYLETHDGLGPVAHIEYLEKRPLVVSPVYYLP